MNREDEIFRKRMIELSRNSFERDVYFFSDFLNLNEIDLFKKINKQELYGDYEISGGYNLAQRQMIKFLPGAVFYDVDYPYISLLIRIKYQKFSQDLSHRDYLGTIMGLGIDRSKVGDIIKIDNGAICFIHESMYDYIQKNLIKVKNTFVEVTRYTEDFNDYEPEYELISGSVQSIRLDAILSLVIKESRSKLVRYIESGSVFVNSKQMVSNAYKLKDGDLISVRGIGKFKYIGQGGISKRGKQFVEIKKYI